MLGDTDLTVMSLSSGIIITIFKHPRLVGMHSGLNMTQLIMSLPLPRAPATGRPHATLTWGRRMADMVLWSEVFTSCYLQKGIYGVGYVF